MRSLPARLRHAVLLCGGAAALVGVGGCAVKREPSDMVNGKKLFVAKCGSCHVLNRASTKGTVGPNLDQAFVRALHDGFKRSAVRSIVEKQILYPNVNGVMPAKLVRGQDAADVAAYVAAVAGKPPSGKGGKITATDGKTIFGQAGCGSCHTLKDAGSTGTVGPNLDDLKPAELKVVTQVTNGGAVMPAFKDRLTRAQIQAVAKYVSSVAGK
jgi:cbb3-type cytochrome c oxidase subunit III